MIRAIFALALLAAPAQAAEKALQASFSINTMRAAAAAPGLSDFMAEEMLHLLKEANDAAERARDEAAAEGRAFRQHRLHASAQERAITADFVSVLRWVETYSGGAHGNVYIETLNWSVRDNALIRLDAILSEDAAGAKALRAIARALRADLSARPDLWPDSIAMATVPDPAALQSFTLEPSSVPGRIGGLAFHFGPYEVGPYSSGPQRVVIGQALFHSGLKPAFRALFDGAPVD